MNLLSIQWNPSLGIELPFLPIRYYSLMFVIAFALGYQIMKFIYKRENVSLEVLDTGLTYVVIATILGARLGHVFFYDWEYFQHHLAEILLPVKFNPFRFTGFSGLASHGAAIGIITALYLYNKKVLHKTLLYILDRVAITVAIGGMFVRLGNLMNSEIIGKPTFSDYGFVFVQLREDFPRHPTQLYEAFGYLLIFFLLMFLYLKTNAKNKEGLLFGVFFALLWSVRFWVEYFKEAQDGETIGKLLNTGQVLSIPLIIIGVFFTVRALKK